MIQILRNSGMFTDQNIQDTYDRQLILDKENIMKKHKLLKNKICALILILVGIITLKLDGNGTFLIILLCFGVPLFFAKEDWIS